MPISTRLHQGSKQLLTVEILCVRSTNLFRHNVGTPPKMQRTRCLISEQHLRYGLYQRFDVVWGLIPHYHMDCYEFSNCYTANLLLYSILYTCCQASRQKNGDSLRDGPMRHMSANPFTPTLAHASELLRKAHSRRESIHYS